MQQQVPRPVDAHVQHILEKGRAYIPAEHERELRLADAEYVAQHADGKLRVGKMCGNIVPQLLCKGEIGLIPVGGDGAGGFQRGAEQYGQQRGKRRIRWQRMFAEDREQPIDRKSRAHPGGEHGGFHHGTQRLRN